MGEFIQDTPAMMKANAIIALMSEAHEFGNTVNVDNLRYILKDLDLSEDSLNIMLALAALATTFLVLLSNEIKVNPSDLFYQCITNDS